MAVTMVAGSLLIGVSAAFGDIGTNLSYMCAGASGVHKVSVHIAGVAPSTVLVGKPISVGPVTVTVSIPNNATELLGPGSGMVNGAVRLMVGVDQGEQRRDAQWPALPVDPVKASDTGKTDLVASGSVLPMTVTATGKVNYFAGPLTLTVGRGGSSNGGGTPSPTGTSSTSAVSVTCRPAREVKLASISVVGGSSTTSSSNPGNSITAAPKVQTTCTTPAGKINKDDPDLKFPDVDIPASYLVASTDNAGNGRCASAAGFANVSKLNAAAPVSVRFDAHDLIDTLKSKVITDPYNYNEDNGYEVAAFSKDSSATALGFGFMPMMATTELGQTGIGNFRMSTMLSPRGNIFRNTIVAARAKEHMRVKGVNVNGVSLKIGEKCAPRGDVLTQLAANNRSFNWYTYGATYFPDPTGSANNFTIPPFSGCGVGEDLSPLVTASVSGSGNQAELIQGPMCAGTAGGSSCDLQPPAPWTVEPGGTVVLNATTPIAFISPMVTVTCNSAKMSMALPKGIWKSGLTIAPVTGVSFGGCSRTGPTGTVAVTVTNIAAAPWAFSLAAIAGDGSVTGQLSEMRLAVQDKDVPNGCHAELGSGTNPLYPGYITTSYDNRSKKLSFGSASLKDINISNCVGIFGGKSFTTTGSFGLSPEQTFSRS